MKPRILIVDDESPARRKVRAALGGSAGEISEAAGGREAVEAIRKARPDLVFLDVQMPGMTGFEVIEEIGVDAMPPVVFVTAFDEHALEAFDVHAADYLLKPFTAERFRLAFDRASARIGETAPDPGALAALLERVASRSAFLRRVIVRREGRILFVPVAEVVNFTAEGNYVRVRTALGADLVRETLAAIESRLDPARFCRVHRSAIVNIAAIAEIQPQFHGDAWIVLKNGDRLRLSRRYQERLLGNPAGSGPG